MGRVDIKTDRVYPVDYMFKKVDEMQQIIENSIVDINDKVDGHTTQLAEIAIPPNNIKLQDTIGISIHNIDASKATKLKSYGFNYVRVDMNWNHVETSLGVYNFTEYDARHSIIVNAGLKPYYILDYVNTLYGAANNLADQTMQDAFVNFAMACVNHYKNQNIIWEIYNEPNGGFWSPQTATTPNDYTNVVKRLYSQIKSSDSTATVVTPALAANGIYWLESACQSGLLNNTDAITVHPYTNVSPEKNQSTYDMFLALLRKYSNKQISLWCGEFGYSTVPNWNGSGNIAVADESTQAKYLVRTYFMNAMNGIGKTMIYDDFDDSLSLTDTTNAEYFFGIFHSDGTDKPASTAIKNIIPSLTNYHFVERLKSNGEDYVLKFKNDTNQIAYVAWTTATSHSVTIGGSTVTITDSPIAIFNAQDTTSPIFSDKVLSESKQARDTAMLSTYQNSLLGLGANVGGFILQNTDLNTVYTEGKMISINGNCTNQPLAGAWGRMICFGQRGKETAQLFVQDRTNRTFIRTRTEDNGWYSWDEIAKMTSLNAAGFGNTELILDGVDLNNYFTGNLVAKVQGTCLNLPYTNAYGSLICSGKAGTEITQTFIALRNNRMFTRYKTYDTGWSSWDEKASLSAIPVVADTGWLSQTLLNGVTGGVKYRKRTVGIIDTVSIYINVANLPINVGTVVANIGTTNATTSSFQNHLVCPQDRFNKKCQVILDPNGDLKVYTDSNFTSTDTANGMITYMR